MGRPEEVESITPRAKTGCGYLYLTVSTNADYEEVFLKLGKTGGCPAAFLQALAMVTSVAMRAGVPREKIVKILSGISCPNPCWDGSVHNLSCPDAVSKMLTKEG